VAHSAGFELAWLQEGAQQLNLAWEPRRGFDCSLVAARLYQRRHTALNLGILTRLYMGVDIKALSTIDVARVRQTRLETVIPYNGLDALGSFRVFDAIGDKVDPDNYAQLIETIESVTAMQLQGLDVSQEAAHRLYEQWQGRAVAAARQAETVHEVRQYVRDTQVEFRIGSDEQLGQVLTKYSFLPLPRNKDGSFKVDDSTINALAPDHPLCRLAIDHRHSRKMAATYVLPYIEARTKNADGRIHPSYSVALTRTYRTSAEDPSIQNFPHRVDNEIREPVVAPPGKIFAAFDFSSLEARVYGMASKDRNLCRSLINGLDIHYKWLDRALELYPPYIDRLAKRVYPNETFEQIRKGGRDGVIKSDLVFASFFGVSAKSVSARTDIPLEIVYDILSEFWTEYPEAANWIKTQRKLYRETGTAVDLFNRERYAILWGNEPLNLCVQGTAARLVLEAQNELYKLSKKERDDNLCPKINIHDDLVFSIDDASTPVLMDYIREIARIMCRPRHRFQTVPMAVDCRVGYNWADLHSCYKHTGTYH
jgi:DNA polymerase-1